MSDAPERIWACVSKNTKSGVVTLLGDATFPVDGWQEYVRADRIEALTEQLAAARQDAKAAEDELEMQEQEGCMMENDYIKLEKERDALEAKLAKAVEALEVYACGPECVNGKCYDTGGSCGQFAADTLAEIKGESHE